VPPQPWSVGSWKWLVCTETTGRGPRDRGDYGAHRIPPPGRQLLNFLLVPPGLYQAAYSVCLSAGRNTRGYDGSKTEGGAKKLKGDVEEGSLSCLSIAYTLDNVLAFPDQNK
jgi:hypothetical protein